MNGYAEQHDLGLVDSLWNTIDCVYSALDGRFHVSEQPGDVCPLFVYSSCEYNDSRNQTLGLIISCFARRSPASTRTQCFTSEPSSFHSFLAKVATSARARGGKCHEVS